MSLQAIIMAGGEGTRLRPLTCDTPKPMVPILGRPVLSYSLQLLRRHKLTEVGVSLLYLPERVTRAFGSGEKDGVRLHYSREKDPVGTAGSVKLVAQGRLRPEKPFVVLSGDGLTDCDLTAALRFHAQKRALATLVLARVREPLAYGVVVTDENGRVTRFVEKPGWGEVYSDTVNTGIYVLSPEALDRIPDGPCDFGQQLFPQLVRESEPVYGFVTDAYWCDIGDESAYVRAQADFLDGRVRLDAGTRIAETAQIAPSARLEGNVYVGAGAVIGENALLCEGAVIGPGARVGAHARISRSVLWEDARAGEWARISGAVLCRGAQAGAGAELYENSALGDGAVLGARAVLASGAKVWPGKRIDPCVRVRGNLVWGGAARPEIRAGQTRCARPEDACILAAAWRYALDAETLALCHDASADGEALCAAAYGALLACGAKTILLGAAPPPVLRAAQTLCRAGAGLRFLRGGKAQLTADGGVLPARSVERKAEALCARQDYPAPFTRGRGETVRLADAESLYIGAITADTAHRPGDSSPRVRAFAADERDAALLRRALDAAGYAAAVELLPEKRDSLPQLEPWETGFRFAAGLERVEIFDCRGMPDSARQTLLAFAALPAEERAWTCRLDAPAALDELARSRGASLSRVGGDDAVWDAALWRAGTTQYRIQRDGVYRMLRLCARMAREGTTLRGMLQALPAVEQRAAHIAVPLRERGSLLRMLYEATPGAALDGSLRLPLENGWVPVSGDSGEPDLVVCGEASRSETAEELCGAILNKLKTLMPPAPSTAP